MGNLREIEWPKGRRFKSNTRWEPAGFFSDCLCNSTQFDLMLGFFSSSAINLLSDSFAIFIANGGRMRMIINDVLSDEDQKAISSGMSNKSFVPAFDLTNIENLLMTLSERGQHFFDCLSYLIREKRIEIQIVRPKGGGGIAHNKCGLFFNEEDNKVAFEGSCNFSRTALIENNESFSVFCSWDGETDCDRIADIAEDFNRTFSGGNEFIEYIDPSNLKTSILSSYKSKDLAKLLDDEKKIIESRLRTDLTPSLKRSLKRAKDKVERLMLLQQSKTVACEDENEYGTPHFPYPSGPRDYQKEAFENWKKNNQRGLFAMATGTGKTLTALNCLLEIYQRKGYYKAIILVPTLTLVEQWEGECRKFNFDNIVKVCSNNNIWKSTIANLTALELSTDDTSKISYVIICTYSSFARSSVFLSLNKFPKDKLLLVADEAHNMGSGEVSKRLPDITYLRRIGLSATPERQFDEEGTHRLMDFFGCSGTYTYEYSMEEAIQNGFLCPYYYYPHIVRLTDKEMMEYVDISMRIVRMMGYGDEKSREMLKNLLLKRKRIIHKAENKREIFKKIVEERFSKTGSLKYTLVYVPEGNRPDNEMADIFDSKDYLESNEEDEHLIDQYTAIIRDIDRHIIVRQFTSESTDRDDMLRGFADGSLHVLTSMKCLDEGVDVPRSEFAIFCSSTGNPRQFIQRRGRVLRTHPDKQCATIHDLIVLPYAGELPSGDLYSIEKSMVENEIKRVRDFALLSKNCHTSINELDEILEMYNISIFE